MHGAVQDTTPRIQESRMAQDPRHTPAWKRLRLECYKRDKERNAVCVHCGQPIDYSARPSSTDNSYEPCCPRTYSQVIGDAIEQEGRKRA